MILCKDTHPTVVLDTSGTFPSARIRTSRMAEPLRGSLVPRSRHRPCEERPRFEWPLPSPTSPRRSSLSSLRPAVGTAAQNEHPIRGHLASR